MNWTTTSTTVVIGIAALFVLLAGFIIWKIAKDDEWYVLAWFSGAGAMLVIVVLALVAICQAQTDQIRAIKCRAEVAPVVLQAHPEWSVQETNDAIGRICP